MSFVYPPHSLKRPLTTTLPQPSATAGMYNEGTDPVVIGEPDSKRSKIVLNNEEQKAASNTNIAMAPSPIKPDVTFIDPELAYNLGIHSFGESNDGNTYEPYMVRQTNPLLLRTPFSKCFTFQLLYSTVATEVEDWKPSPRLYCRDK